MTAARAVGGFTLIELLTVLLIMSLLALMSFRGLDVVLESRDHVVGQTRHWQRVAAFSERFQRDVQMASPRQAPVATGVAPAWVGTVDPVHGSRLEFSRFAAVEGVDAPRRVAYGLNEHGEIELWLWHGLDAVPAAPRARYPVLQGVLELEFEYLDGELNWVPSWPVSARDNAMPRAVRMRFVLADGGEIVRVFALDS